MTTTAETPQGSAVARAPRVFLSHATADHEFVESVRETLEAARPWGQAARPWGQTDLEFILLPVPGVRPISAAHNAVGLAGESPVVGIDCLPT